MLLQGPADGGEDLPAAATSVAVQVDGSMLAPKKLAQLAPVAAWGLLK